MKKWRRYEILLPLRFNDGTRVQKRLLAATVKELEKRFGAVSTETQVIQGRWTHGPKTYRDDAEATPEVQAYFVEFKTRAKERFDQLDIWLTSHSIEVI
jgi:hypothetical protein